MNRPEYLVSYLPYSRNTVHEIHKVVGDTEKYWKCLLRSDGTTFLVRKSNLMCRGGDIKYYAWTKEQVIEYKTHSRLVQKFKCLNPSLLSTKQLEEILKIAGGEENAI
jgi:hypothetical protein